MRSDIKRPQKASGLSDDDKDQIVDIVLNDDKPKSPESNKRERKKLPYFITWLQKNRNQVLIGTAIVLLLLIVFSVFIPRFSSNSSQSNLKFKLGNKQVTKSEYEDFASRYTSYLQKHDQKISSQEARQRALNFLIEVKALEIEAEKNKISVSDDEINQNYKKTTDLVGGEEKYRDTVAELYYWTPELTRLAIRKNILEEKLRPIVLKERVAYGVWARWDYEGMDIGKAELDKNKELAKKSLEPVLPLFNNKASEEEIKAAIQDVRKDSPPEWPEAVLGVSDNRQGLNDETAKKVFENQDDWKAIAKLKNLDQNTGIFESGGGYMAIYRLKSITNGQYNSFQQMFDEAYEKTKIYALGNKAEQMLSLITGRADAKLSICKDGKKRSLSWLDKILGVDKAYADINCGDHWSATADKVLNGLTNIGIPGAYAEFHAANRDPYCRPVPGEGESNYEALDFAVYTNWAGEFVVDSEPKGDARKISCWTRWNITVSAPGYYPAVWGNISVQQNNSWFCVDNLNASGSPSPTYSGQFIIWNTDKNCHLFLLPTTPPPGEVVGYKVEYDTRNLSLPEFVNPSVSAQNLSTGVTYSANGNPFFIRNLPSNYKYRITSQAINGWRLKGFYEGPNFIEAQSYDVDISPGASRHIWPAYERYFTPWLQVKQGNVMGGKITGQEIGRNGGRALGVVDKEAEFVIISYLDGVINSFCSSNQYLFGGSQSGDSGCSGGLYSINQNYQKPEQIIPDLGRTISEAISKGNNCTNNLPRVENLSVGGTGKITSPGTNIASVGGSTCQNGVVWRYSGSAILSSQTINEGRGTYYIDGDLLIDGDIKSEKKVALPITSVPNLGLIVKGNITIEPNVKRIDAAIFASGKIKTCGSNYTIAKCSNQLTVNGLMAALGGFQFGRGYVTSFNGSTGNPAETIVYQGKIILAPPPGFGESLMEMNKRLKYESDLSPRF